MSGRDDDGVARFERHRRRLFGVAYRMTGSVADAEDCVQEAYLRWQRADHGGVVNDEAFLVTMVSRVGYDRLRRIVRRRESYVGPWLPEPLVRPIADASPADDPAAHAELADTLSFAFLVLLDRLSPAERAAFIMHDVFGLGFDEVAQALDRQAAACRQLASRARRKLRDDSRHGDDEVAPQERPIDAPTLGRLVGALLSGDMAACIDYMAPDVTLTSDAGPSRRAARHDVVGATRVVRLLANLARRDGDKVLGVHPVTVNGASGLFIDHADGPIVITGVVSGDGLVRRIWIAMNPDKVRDIADVGR